MTYFIASLFISTNVGGGFEPLKTIVTFRDVLSPEDVDKNAVESINTERLSAFSSKIAKPASVVSLI